MPTDQISAFIEAHIDELVQKFRHQAILVEHDLRKNSDQSNARTLFQMMTGYLRSMTTLEEIKQFAFKVAQERKAVRVDIGDFVSNICLGRRLVLELLIEGELPTELRLKALPKINECFDTFLVHSVSHYTDLKNNDLKEKQMFIERSHKDKLTILGQMASSFVHEFRNPLTSIIGFSRLLKEDYPDLPYVDIIQNELKQLNFRISQFLLASKKGTVDQRFEMVQIQSLIDEILGFLYPAIVDVNADILCEIDPVCTVSGSRDEVRQVLINIISNALDALQKVQGHKQIVIRATQSADMTTIRVSNNGVPIPADLLPLIFEPFFTTKETGTGIGLYVCKEIIERHNGTINCESTEDQTTFSMHFRLPPPH